jgi:hypothetical protein
MQTLPFEGTTFKVELGSSPIPERTFPENNISKFRQVFIIISINVSLHSAVGICLCLYECEGRLELSSLPRWVFISAC